STSRTTGSPYCPLRAAMSPRLLPVAGRGSRFGSRVAQGRPRPYAVVTSQRRTRTFLLSGSGTRWRAGCVPERSYCQVLDRGGVLGAYQNVPIVRFWYALG